MCDDECGSPWAIQVATPRACGRGWLYCTALNWVTSAAHGREMPQLLVVLYAAPGQRLCVLRENFRLEWAWVVWWCVVGRCRY
jgi:hypothetical protein